MSNVSNSFANGTYIKPPHQIHHELYSEPAKIVTYSLVYGLIASVGLVGNIMVFMVICKNRSMQTTTNILLLNLSLSDMLLIVCSVPGLLALEICNERWVFGEVMAKVTSGFTIFCGASSVFTLIAIALERYFAVVHPLKQMVRKKKAAVITAITIIWICSITLSTTEVIFTGVHSHEMAAKDGETTEERQKIYFIQLSMDKEALKVYQMTIFVVFNIVPISLLTFFYTRIAWKLWNPDRLLNQEHAGANYHGKSENVVTRARRKTTVMVIVVLVEFFVCMLPYNLLRVITTYIGIEHFDLVTLQWSNSILRILVVVNSATNPIIYNFLSEGFRNGFRKIARNWCTAAEDSK